MDSIEDPRQDEFEVGRRGATGVGDGGEVDIEPYAVRKVWLCTCEQCFRDVGGQLGIDSHVVLHRGIPRRLLACCSAERYARGPNLDSVGCCADRARDKDGVAKVRCAMCQRFDYLRSRRRLSLPPTLNPASAISVEGP